jgi:exonuclease III
MQERNPSTNQKEDSHKNRIPTLTTKIKGSNNYFSLKSLNINGLNTPIKRHRLTDWLHKQDPTFSCSQETHLREKDRHYLRVKGWKTIFQANALKKQAGADILISNKIDFQPKVFKKKKKKQKTKKKKKRSNPSKTSK